MEVSGLLADLDFAGDLALLCHTQRQMQEKTSRVMSKSARLGLKVHMRKREVLKNKNMESTTP